LVIASHDNFSTDYAAVRSGGAGLIDFSTRGRVVVTGSEAVMFLNGLITNDMKTLALNMWMPAAFPNVQGRLLAMVRIIHQQAPDTSEEEFLIDTEAATHDQVLKIIERFTLAGDFHVHDRSPETGHLSLQGIAASRLVADVFGEPVAAVEDYSVVQTNWLGHNVTLFRATHTGADGYDLLFDSAAADQLRSVLIEAGAEPVGPETFETLRIEGGVPRYGIDMDETNVVSETGLDDAVSFTKGCYIGQEIIARIKYRGHVAKRLAGLVFEGSTIPEPGTKISVADKDIGRVTSATLSPALKSSIALGYVKYDYLAPGTEVRVGETAAKVVELPFVTGKSDQNVA
jgi:folate-binding protein YgfZ